MMTQAFSQKHTVHVTVHLLSIHANKTGISYRFIFVFLQRLSVKITLSPPPPHAVTPTSDWISMLC